MLATSSFQMNHSRSSVALLSARVASGPVPSSSCWLFLSVITPEWMNREIFWLLLDRVASICLWKRWAVLVLPLYFVCALSTVRSFVLSDIFCADEGADCAGRAWAEREQAPLPLDSRGRRLSTAESSDALLRCVARSKVAQSRPRDTTRHNLRKVDLAYARSTHTRHRAATRNYGAAGRLRRWLLSADSFFSYTTLCGSSATRAVRLYCTRCSFTQTRRRQEPSSQATPGHPPTRSQQRSSEAAPGFAQTTFEKL